MAAIVRADFRAKSALFPKAGAPGPACGGAMFITPAFAQGFGGANEGMILQFMPLILIVLIMYFLILRPQQRKIKQHQEMVKALRRGDTVVTSGGLVAKVTRVVDDDQIELELGTVDVGKGEAKGVRVRQMRSMVSEVRARGEPVKEESAS
jgi:preprotein translocase subunit YajC